MSKVCADLVPEDELINKDHIRNLFFGNYMEPDADPKYYDEVKQIKPKPETLIHPHLHTFHPSDHRLARLDRENELLFG